MRRFTIDLTNQERRELEAVLRRQFVVRDDQEVLTCFDPAAGDSLDSAIHHLTRHFHAPDGDGYAGTDMVVWRDRRIMAVVRMGANGEPEVTRFGDSPA